MSFLELAAEKNEEWSTTMLMTKSGLSYIEAFNMLEDSFGSISNVVNFLPPITIVALFYFILANLTERFSVWILKEKTLSKKAIELAHAMTGLVNAVVIGFASLSEVLANWNRPISEGTEAYFDSSAALLTLIVGFFVWDLFACIKNVNVCGYKLVLHAAMAIVSSVTSFYPYMMNMVPYWSLYEISTVFLNIRSIFKACNVSKEFWLNRLNDIVFVLTFTVFRIIIGTYLIYSTVLQTIDDQNDAPLLAKAICIITMGLIYCLSLTWYPEIIKAVMKASKKDSANKPGDKLI